MSYIWNNNLETGFRQIDSQHKMLFDTLRRLGHACRDGNGQEELERTVEFLSAYTLKHFAEEEELQRCCNYPDYQRHKQYHDELADVVRGFAWQLAHDGYSFELAYNIYVVLSDWLVHHIKGEDFAMAAYLRRFRGKSAGPGAVPGGYNLPGAPAGAGRDLRAGFKV